MNNLSSVFRLDAKPWIDHDGTSVENRRRKNQTDRDPMVTVSKNGPYLVTGDIDLIGDNIQWAGDKGTLYSLQMWGF